MRLGSLCSGYAGLDMAAHAVFGGTTAWVADVDPGACKLLAHRLPDVWVLIPPFLWWVWRDCGGRGWRR